jgi:hypothetical protein
MLWRRICPGWGRTSARRSGGETCDTRRIERPTHVGVVGSRVRLRNHSWKATTREVLQP